MPGGSFLCYTPAHDAPPVSATPALSTGFVTFGSFNNLAKVTPEVRGVRGPSGVALHTPGHRPGCAGRCPPSLPPSLPSSLPPSFPPQAPKRCEAPQPAHSGPGRMWDARVQGVGAARSMAAKEH